MAIDILLDADGDIDLTNNKIKLTSSVQESARQQALITLTTYLGEWYFNINHGIPYIKNDNNDIQLLGAGDNKNLIDLYLQEGIISNESVSKLLTYSSSLDKPHNTLSVDFTFLDSSGETVEVNSVLSV